jgi:hypothetical protein
MEIYPTKGKVVLLNTKTTLMDITLNDLIKAEYVFGLLFMQGSREK